ncbi:hypothetical protein C7271_16945 [filamentous cyanobacterium CCP5]|nr:hypothetical protein C7271_16945 [filamentous cyanobacterium CCP5]
MNWSRKIRGGFWVGLGYMLSPLSWWNDLFFNLPIAYGFAYGVTWWYPDWFGPAIVLGYWLSNVLGFVLMQWGVGDIVAPAAQPGIQTEQTTDNRWQRQLWLSLGSSTLYTLIVAGLVYFHLLDLPDFLLS